MLVDIQIDEEHLLAAGYHSEDDCPYDEDALCQHEQGSSCDRLLDALKVMHNEHHEGPFRFCRTEPCRDLP